MSESSVHFIRNQDFYNFVKISRDIKSIVLKKHLLLLLLFCFPLSMFSQVVYQDLNYTDIYDFLDEMANMGLIRIQSAVKPWPRTFIAEKLGELEKQQERLNKRQKKDLAFYLRDYNLERKNDLAFSKEVPGLFRKKKDFGIPLSPFALLYKDSLFTFSLRPILGLQYYFNPGMTTYHRWDGAEIFGYVGRHFGFYASLRDNHETRMMSDSILFTQDEGAAWKSNGQNSYDYSEMRGGITYAWKWGSVAFIKDHFQWGDNYYGSNILSGRTPSFPYLELRMKPVKWFDFTYMHGWLVSQVVDSSRAYMIQQSSGQTRDREYFFNKFIAGSMFTFTPLKNLDLSIGNSVVYCAQYPNPAFLSPFLIFINFSYDNTKYNSDFEKARYGNNSQLFFNVSSRQIKYLHLYGSVFLDGFSWQVMTDKDRHNYVSYKGGFRLSDFPLKNISLTGEYTFTTPVTYRDSVTTLTYASNLYNLGHYMRDNSQDIYVAIAYRPLRGLNMKFYYDLAEHGNDGLYGSYSDMYGVPVLSDLTWRSRSLGLELKYEVTNNANVFLAYMNHLTSGDPKYTPPQYRGYNNTVSAGFNIGF
jgi:hypothetical protein